MNNRLGIRALVGALAICGSLAALAPVRAEKLYTRDVIERVGVDQMLDAQVPGDVRLVDETGRRVRLDEYYQDKPIVLNLVYFECPMLCNMTMDGLQRSLKILNLDVGNDFTVLTVSFDPREGPKLASQARKTALKRYDRAGAEAGWRFLTGEEAQLRRLTESVGFRYVYDEDRGQYAHAAALVVLTPSGRVSRYLTGVEFPARDLRLALVEASNHQIGTPLDRAMLLCYHYDPITGRYGLAVLNVVRFFGVVTVGGLVTMILLSLRREKRQQLSLAQQPEAVRNPA